MFLLLAFSFLAGVVTILSPCILPVLPIILSSSVDNSGKRRPFGVVIGFVASFTFFTLFLSIIVAASGIPADSLRLISIIILFVFGLSLLMPGFQTFLERLFSSLSRFAPSGQGRTGFSGGLIIGFSLGLLWTPCVGPILASVISLAISGTVTFQAFLITLAFSLGTAIPMFLIMLAGSTALQRIPWLTRNSASIQKVFGVLMIVTALAIFFNLDRRFQTFVLKTFPSYGVGLTQIEENEGVRDELEKVTNTGVEAKDLGKPMSELTHAKGPIAPEIIPGGEWFNSEPLQLSSLRGKVVVVDFWTYSCINCQRTLPYLRDWWKKYEDDGLVIIGVHAPEFEFEKNRDNVEKAISDFGIKYPVVQDNDFATWRAYSNRYWPAKYFIDKDGLIRFTHFGEGAYDESEEVIRTLLKETGTSPVDAVENPDYQVYSNTPETYLGYLRLANIASDEAIKRDAKFVYTKPAVFPDNYFALEGEWTVMPEYSAPGKNAKLYLNFDAKEVFLVARPKNGQGKINVYVDGRKQYFGEDNIDGTVTVNSDSLYKLVNIDEPGKHQLMLEFPTNNVEVYAFTFG